MPAVHCLFFHEFVSKTHARGDPGQMKKWINVQKRTWPLEKSKGSWQQNKSWEDWTLKDFIRNRFLKAKWFGMFIQFECIALHVRMQVFRKLGFIDCNLWYPFHAIWLLCWAIYLQYIVKDIDFNFQSFWGNEYLFELLFYCFPLSSIGDLFRNPSMQEQNFFKASEKSQLVS